MVERAHFKRLSHENNLKLENQRVMSAHIIDVSPDEI